MENNFQISYLNSFDLIEFEEHLKNTSILYRFDPYSPLYYLILHFNLKLVSLEIILTRLCVFSMTAQIHHIQESRHRFFEIMLTYLIGKETQSQGNIVVSTSHVAQSASRDKIW